MPQKAIKKRTHFKRVKSLLLGRKRHGKAIQLGVIYCSPIKTTFYH